MKWWVFTLHLVWFGQVWPQVPSYLVGLPYPLWHLKSNLATTSGGSEILDSIGNDMVSAKIGGQSNYHRWRPHLIYFLQTWLLSNFPQNIIPLSFQIQPFVANYSLSLKHKDARGVYYVKTRLSQSLYVITSGDNDISLNYLPNTSFQRTTSALDFIKVPTALEKQP